VNPSAIADEVERYLRTGETDPHHAAWPGNASWSAPSRVGRFAADLLTI